MVSSEVDSCFTFSALHQEGAERRLRAHARIGQDAQRTPAGLGAQDRRSGSPESGMAARFGGAYQGACAK
jgi:hypothetical protein